MPTIVSNPLCKFAAEVKYESGTPILEVESEDNLSAVFKDGENFILWIRENKIINKVIKNENIEFYFDNDELVGIKATEKISNPE